MGKIVRQAGRKIPLRQQLLQLIGILPDLRQAQFVLRQQPLIAGIEQRGTEARNDGRHTPQQLFVNHRRLREVSHLRRPADVGDCGQQVILDYRAQQRIAAEFLGMLPDARQQFRFV